MGEKRMRNRMWFVLEAVRLGGLVDRGIFAIALAVLGLWPDRLAAGVTMFNGFEVDRVFTSTSPDEMRSFDWGGDGNLYYDTGNFVDPLLEISSSNGIASTAIHSVNKWPGGGVQAYSNTTDDFVYFYEDDPGTFQQNLFRYASTPNTVTEMIHGTAIFGVHVHEDALYVTAVGSGGFGTNAIFYSPIASDGSVSSLTSIGDVGSASGPVAFDETGNLYFADGLKTKIYRYSPLEVAAAIEDPLNDPLPNPASHVWTDYSSLVLSDGVTTPTGGTGLVVDQFGDLVLNATGFGVPSALVIFEVATDGSNPGWTIAAEGDSRFGSVRLRNDSILFNDTGSVYRLIPEPATGGILLLGGLLLGRRRHRPSGPVRPCSGLCHSEGRRCRLWFLMIGALIGLTISSSTLGAEFFATEVVGTTIGHPNQHPSFDDSEKAIEGPQGQGATAGSIDVYNLGVGGAITLGFDSTEQVRAMRDGPGVDFIVFENPFYFGGVETSSFAELMFVEVSSNGLDFARFPAYSDTPSMNDPFGSVDPEDVSGLAGVNPVLANVAVNQIDPFDASEAGGDPFDLADLGDHPLVLSGDVNLDRIRFVQMVDIPGDGSQLDDRGQPIYDAYGPPNGGADLDAVAVIHGFAFGDMDDSGTIDNLDIGPFVTALRNSDPNTFETLLPSSIFYAADTNLDGLVDEQDTNSFLGTLMDAGSSPVQPMMSTPGMPEPSTSWCVTLLWAMGRMRKRG